MRSSNMDKDLAVSAVASALRRHGLTSAMGQKLVRVQARQGSVQVAVEAVASTLLYEGIRDGKIPKPAGVKLKELADRAEAAILEAVNDYHSRGGVLTAKNYATPLQLVAETAKQWIRAFEAVEVLEAGVPLDTEDVDPRLAVVARVAGLTLLDAGGWLERADLSLAVKDRPTALALLAKVSSIGGVVTLDAKQLEGLCMRLAKSMYDTFQHSADEAHAALHGEKP